MRTGPELSDRHVLADGTSVVLRHIRPTDAPELLRGFERLSPESRYRRFFGGVSTLSEEALRYLTEVDGYDHVAIVATTESPDLKNETGLGVGRFVRLHDEPSVAEAAVTVLDDAQRKGLGRLLATTLGEAARERGVRTLRAAVLAENAPMIALMRDIGAPEQHVEAGVITYDIPLESVSGATPGAIDRLLRAAGQSVAILLRRIALPPQH